MKSEGVSSKTILESKRIELSDNTFWKIEYSQSLPQWMGGKIKAILFVPITQTNPEKMDGINIGYSERSGIYNDTVINAILSSKIQTNKINFTETDSKIVVREQTSFSGPNICN